MPRLNEYRMPAAKGRKLSLPRLLSRMCGVAHVARHRLTIRSVISRRTWPEKPGPRRRCATALLLLLLLLPLSLQPQPAVVAARRTCCCCCCCCCCRPAAAAAARPGRPPPRAARNKLVGVETDVVERVEVQPLPALGARFYVLSQRHRPHKLGVLQTRIQPGRRRYC